MRGVEWQSCFWWLAHLLYLCASTLITDRGSNTGQPVSCKTEAWAGSSSSIVRVVTELHAFVLALRVLPPACAALGTLSGVGALLHVLPLRAD